MGGMGEGGGGRTECAMWNGRPLEHPDKEHQVQPPPGLGWREAGGVGIGWSCTHEGAKSLQQFAEYWLLCRCRSKNGLAGEGGILVDEFLCIDLLRDCDVKEI